MNPTFSLRSLFPRLPLARRMAPWISWRAAAGFALSMFVGLIGVLFFVVVPAQAAITTPARQQLPSTNASVSTSPTSIFGDDFNGPYPGTWSMGQANVLQPAGSTRGLPATARPSSQAAAVPKFWVPQVDERFGQRLSLPISFWGFVSENADEDFITSTDQRQEDPINLIFFGKRARPLNVAAALGAAGWSVTPLPYVGFTCPDNPRLAFPNLDPKQARSSNPNLGGHRMWRLADHAVGRVASINECVDEYHVRLWDWGTVVVGGETFEVTLGQIHHDCVLACGQLDLPEMFLATTKDWKQRRAARERGCPRGRIPNDLSLRERHPA